MICPFGNKFGTCVSALLLWTQLTSSWAKCPFAHLLNSPDTPLGINTGHTHLRALRYFKSGDGGIPEGGFDAVTADIIAALTESQDFFPADFGNYGPLMIRLAWHCSGSYRQSDGRGGCDGGRIRFDPENSWADNENLDKALKILEPIKEKYGSSLSWGDLIVLSGNAAIQSMGGPILGFCGGRIDDADGTASLPLGPSEEQQAIAPCEVNGNCSSPLGPTTMGLIYVNPEGPMGIADPDLSAPDVRNAFERMGMNDSETVALIGGGHAFGKAHGPCPDPPCGTGEMKGKGSNTWTSGFEGQWTTLPTTWTNQYFKNLLEYNWTAVDGPGGFVQWSPKRMAGDGSVPPDVFMLTTDVALIRDPIYKEFVNMWAEDIEPLELAFQHAWYKLTAADMGPPTRCIGDNVPPPQPFQMPLPEAPAELPDFVPVRSSIQELLDEEDTNVASFVTLAYQCASTYRDTDHKGGCNGARIRFAPEKDWPSNEGMADVLATLEPIKDQYQDVSWADLIVLAGNAALEHGGGDAMAFCGGRVDAESGDPWTDFLAPRVYTPATVSVRDDMLVKGLTPEEMVALAGRPTDSSTVSNELFVALTTEDIIESTNGSIEGSEGTLFTADQYALIQDEEFKAIVESYAADEELFKTQLAAAWTKLMNADRFSGPRKNACAGVDTPTIKGS